MEVIECIKSRRSIRNYRDEALPKEIIEKIIEAGRYAPSAENRQPWRFVVITNKALIKELSEKTKKEIAGMLRRKRKFRKKYPGLDDRQTLLFFQAVANSSRDVIFHDAPAVVFIITENKAFYDESCACAAENMMLAAWSMGIGSCWIGFAKFLEMNREAREKIGLPADHHIAACLVFGYPEKVPKKALPRNPMAGIIKWID